MRGAMIERLGRICLGIIRLFPRLIGQVGTLLRRLSTPFLFALSLLLAVGLPLGYSFWRGVRSMLAPAPQRITSKPVLVGIRELSELAVTRVRVAKMMVVESDDVEIAWIVYGYADLGVDLSRTRLVCQDDVARRLVVSLPPPQLLVAVVDEECSGPYEVETKWFSNAQEVEAALNEVPKAAQRIIALAAAERLEEAKPATEELLQGFAAACGWTVETEWRSQEESGRPDRQPPPEASVRQPE